ncbi:MAG: hypothetical protein AB1899_03905 [Pseudomonadota bacterium]
MTDKDSHPKQNALASDATGQDQNVALGRRRMIKIGATAVPVIMTLASKPVLAWHCKSPSAWGSEQINPNTSLINNPGHASYADETWTITNWRDNTKRSAVGYTDKPWSKLYSAYPCLKNTSCNLSQSGTSWDMITVSKLFSVVPIARPSGLSDTATVKTVLTSGTNFQKYIICSQLNYLLLASKNEMDNCISMDELKKMATGLYTPPGLGGVTWVEADIVSYLNNNWFTRP